MLEGCEVPFGLLRGSGVEDDQGDDAVRSAYGPNYQRLTEIKRQYDPENVFRHNHNIPPAA